MWVSFNDFSKLLILLASGPSLPLTSPRHVWRGMQVIAPHRWQSREIFFMYRTLNWGQGQQKLRQNFCCAMMSKEPLLIRLCELANIWPKWMLRTDWI